MYRTPLVSNFSMPITPARGIISHNAAWCGATAIETIIGPHAPTQLSPLRIPSVTHARSAFQLVGGIARNRWQPSRRWRFQRVNSQPAAAANTAESAHRLVVSGPRDQITANTTTPAAD